MSYRIFETSMTRLTDNVAHRGSILTLESLGGATFLSYYNQRLKCICCSCYNEIKVFRLRQNKNKDLWKLDLNKDLWKLNVNKDLWKLDLIGRPFWFKIWPLHKPYKDVSTLLNMPLLTKLFSLRLPRILLM